MEDLIILEHAYYRYLQSMIRDAEKEGYEKIGGIEKDIIPTFKGCPDVEIFVQKMRKIRE